MEPLGRRTGTTCNGALASGHFERRLQRFVGEEDEDGVAMSSGVGDGDDEAMASGTGSGSPYADRERGRRGGSG